MDSLGLGSSCLQLGQASVLTFNKLFQAMPEGCKTKDPFSGEDLRMTNRRQLKKPCEPEQAGAVPEERGALYLRAADVGNSIHAASSRI